VSECGGRRMEGEVWSGSGIPQGGGGGEGGGGVAPPWADGRDGGSGDGPREASDGGGFDEDGFPPALAAALRGGSARRRRGMEYGLFGMNMYATGGRHVDYHASRLDLHEVEDAAFMRAFTMHAVYEPRMDAVVVPLCRVMEVLREALVGRRVTAEGLEALFRYFEMEGGQGGILVEEFMEALWRLKERSRGPQTARAYSSHARMRDDRARGRHGVFQPRTSETVWRPQTASQEVGWYHDTRRPGSARQQLQRCGDYHGRKRTDIACGEGPSWRPF